jgi:hypothetical protein
MSKLIMYTLNNQSQLLPMPSTGTFGSIIGRNSSAASAQEALSKAKIFANSKGYIVVSNGIEAVETRPNYYVVPLKQKGGRRTRRGKRSRRNKTHRRKSCRYRR